jgi:hypothetical protein
MTLPKTVKDPEDLDQEGTRNGTSPFPQSLVRQGPGTYPAGSPEYGVLPHDQPPTEDRIPFGAKTEAGWHPDLEYIHQFNDQNKLLQNIYDAIVGRVRPAVAMFECQLNTQRIMAVRMTLEWIVLTNITGAGVTATLTLGTRVYTFGLQANQTLPIPFPLVIDNGTNILFTNCSGMLVGILSAARS